MVRRPAYAQRMDAWGYIGIGVLLALIGGGLVVGGAVGVGLAALGVGLVPLLIGVVAEGVRIGNRDSD